jgi:hypothetical protein
MAEISNNYMIPNFQTSFDFNAQKNTNNNLVTGFESALKLQESLPAMRSRYETQYQIPQLRESVQSGQEAMAGLASQIKAMPGQVAGTTRESMVTEGQRAGMVQSKQAPLIEGYQGIAGTTSQLAGVLSQNEQNMNSAMQMEIAQQKKDLEPWEWKYDLDKVMQAREFAGWSTQSQMELQRLQSNQQAGVQVSEGEKNRQAQLEMQKQKYEQTLQSMEKGYELENKYSQTGYPQAWDWWNS